jgi:hypothetical protein
LLSTGGRVRTEGASEVVMGTFTFSSPSMEDKMLMEKAFRNTGWTSTRVNQTLLLLNHPGCVDRLDRCSCTPSKSVQIGIHSIIIL